MIAYASKTLKGAELNYSATEKECSAIIFAVHKFRPYIYGQQFTIITDHNPLCWLMKVKNPNGRLIRWSLTLQEFDFGVKYKPGRKHSDADGLSRLPVQDFDEDPGIPSLFALGEIFERQEQDPGINKLRNEMERKPSSNIRMVDGAICKLIHGHDGDRSMIWAPKSIRKDILRQLHDDPQAARQLRLQKTWNRIRRRFFWPKMLADIQRYINSCEACQKFCRSNQTPSGPLQPLPVTEKPFEKIGVGKLGPFYLSQKGNRYILVATDYATKHAVAAATPSGTQYDVVKFLIKGVITRFGAPNELISDRGTEFLNQTVAEITKQLTIWHHKTTAYHPRTIGLTERFNQTLIRMISKCTDAAQQDWDELLDFLTFAYNTATQSSTGFTPFYLLHGYEAALPLDQEISAVLGYPQDCFEKMKLARHSVRASVNISQQKSRDNWKGNTSLDLDHGDKAYVRNNAQKIGLSTKLLPKYEKVVTIKRKVSENVYEVMDENGTADLASAERLKRLNEKANEGDDPSPATTRPKRIVRRPVRFKDYIS